MSLEGPIPSAQYDIAAPREEIDHLKLLLGGAQAEAWQYKSQTEELHERLADQKEWIGALELTVNGASKREDEVFATVVDLEQDVAQLRLALMPFTHPALGNASIYERARAAMKATDDQSDNHEDDDDDDDW